MEKMDYRNFVNLLKLGEAGYGDKTVSDVKVVVTGGTDPSDLSGIVLTGWTFKDVHFGGINFDGTDFNRCEFESKTGVRPFAARNLHNVHFNGCGFHSDGQFSDFLSAWDNTDLRFENCEFDSHPYSDDQGEPIIAGTLSHSVFKDCTFLGGVSGMALSNVVFENPFVPNDGTVRLPFSGCTLYETSIESRGMNDHGFELRLHNCAGVEALSVDYAYLGHDVSVKVDGAYAMTDLKRCSFSSERKVLFESEGGSLSDCRFHGTAYIEGPEDFDSCEIRHLAGIGADGGSVRMKDVVMDYVDADAFVGAQDVSMDGCVMDCVVFPGNGNYDLSMIDRLSGGRSDMQDTEIRSFAAYRHPDDPDLHYLDKLGNGVLSNHFRDRLAKQPSKDFDSGRWPEGLRLSGTSREAVDAFFESAKGRMSELPPFTKSVRGAEPGREETDRLLASAEEIEKKSAGPDFSFDEDFE